MKKYLPIIAVLIVAGAGLGYLYYQSSDDTKTNNQTSNQQTNNNTQSNNDPSEGGKYLVIKEWEIRFLLPATLQNQGFYFLREITGMGSDTQGADISAKLFSPECRNSADDLGLTIIRTKTELIGPQPYIYQQNILNDGEYWYHAAFGKDGCAKNLKDNKQKAFNDLYEALGGLEKIN